MPALIEIKNPKPRDLNEEMPEFRPRQFPSISLQNVTLLNAEQGIDISNTNVYAQNFTTWNVRNPARIRGGRRHIFDGVHFRNIPHRGKSNNDT
ncbi:MAG: hypothetical protein ACFFCW_49250 [Candidatus Hodarchaeota archaeon]